MIGCGKWASAISIALAQCDMSWFCFPTLTEQPSANPLSKRHDESKTEDLEKDSDSWNTHEDGELFTGGSTNSGMIVATRVDVAYYRIHEVAVPVLILGVKSTPEESKRSRTYDAKVSDKNSLSWTCRWLGCVMNPRHRRSHCCP